MKQVTKQMGTVVTGMDKARAAPIAPSAATQRRARSQPRMPFRGRARTRHTVGPAAQGSLSAVRSDRQVLGSMDVGKISSVMDKFEQSFDRLDAQSAMIDGTLNSATASSMPEDAVEQLMSQVADEHGLAFAAATPAAGTSAVRPEAATTGMEEVEHSLEKRLAALRG